MTKRDDTKHNITKLTKTKTNRQQPPPPPRSVEICVHVRVLDELAAVYLRLHGLLLAEVVVRAVHLPRPGLTGGVTHGEAKPPRKVFEQHVDQSALQCIIRVSTLDISFRFGVPRVVKNYQKTATK